jgi:small subunit ribosomal protein S9
VTPEERDDAAQGPEANDLPEPEEGQEQEAVPGEPGEATPDEAEAAEVPEAPEAEAGDGEAAEAQEAEEPEADTPEQPAADPADAPAAEEPGESEADGAAGESAERDRPQRGDAEKSASDEELIPGAHLEPDLVLEEEARPQSEFGEYDEVGGTDEGAGDETAAVAEAEPVAREPLALAADARYAATGKRKSAVARVILRPGEGTYTINRRHLDEYFPRIRLQRMARQPLEAAGYQNRMDVVARVHGGGVAAQATALRHGVARALVEADPALRGELKRRGYLTRDPRVKERKKAGLKKARKRPQFSKR